MDSPTLCSLDPTKCLAGLAMATWFKRLCGWCLEESICCHSVKHSWHCEIEQYTIIHVHFTLTCWEQDVQGRASLPGRTHRRVHKFLDRRVWTLLVPTCFWICCRHIWSHSPAPTGKSIFWVWAGVGVCARGFDTQKTFDTECQSVHAFVYHLCAFLVWTWLQWCRRSSSPPPRGRSLSPEFSRAQGKGLANESSPSLTWHCHTFWRH